jgi:hypothetical protein
MGKRRLCLVGALAACAVTFVSLGGELDTLLSQKNSLDGELLKAKTAFRKKLPSIAEYAKAKQHLDDCIDAIATLQSKKAGDAEVDAAIRTKISADAALKKLIADLELKDATVAATMKKISEIDAKISEIRAADAEDAKLLKQRVEEVRRANGKLYRDVVDMDFNGEPKHRDSIPLLGDETSLLEPKASPQKFVNRPIIICGLVSISDYYNYGYEDAKPTHFSLSFHEVTANKQLGEYAHLYLDRKKGGPLVDVITRREKSWPHNPWVMRVKVLIDPKFTRTFSDAQELYTLTDWQFLGDDGWTPWYSEVVGQ